MFAVFNIHSQQLPKFSYEYLNRSSINPAFAGQSDYFEGFLQYRLEMTGIKNSPQTSLLTMQSPVINQNAGFGVTMYKDEVNILGSMAVKTMYSYKLNVKKEYNIFLGVATSIIQNKILHENIVAESPSELLRLYNTKPKTSFNVDIGVAGEYQDIVFGISVHSLYNDRIYSRNNELVYDLKKEYNIFGSYNFHYSASWIINPNIVIRSPEGMEFVYDINVTGEYKKMAWCGITFTSKTSVGVLTGMNYKMLRVGYYYSYPIDDISRISDGAHEVFVAYRFKKIKK